MTKRKIYLGLIGVIFGTLQVNVAQASVGADIFKTPNTSIKFFTKNWTAISALGSKLATEVAVLRAQIAEGDTRSGESVRREKQYRTKSKRKKTSLRDEIERLQRENEKAIFEGDEQIKEVRRARRIEEKRLNTKLRAATRKLTRFKREARERDGKRKAELGATKKRLGAVQQELQMATQKRDRSQVFLKREKAAHTKDKKLFIELLAKKSNELTGVQDELGQTRETLTQATQARERSEKQYQDDATALQARLSDAMEKHKMAQASFEKEKERVATTIAAWKATKGTLHDTTERLNETQGKLDQETATHRATQVHLDHSKEQYRIAQENLAREREARVKTTASLTDTKALLRTTRIHLKAMKNLFSNETTTHRTTQESLDEFVEKHRIAQGNFEREQKEVETTTTAWGVVKDDLGKTTERLKDIQEKLDQETDAHRATQVTLNASMEKHREAQTNFETEKNAHSGLKKTFHVQKRVIIDLTQQYGEGQRERQGIQRMLAALVASASRDEEETESPGQDDIKSPESMQFQSHPFQPGGVKTSSDIEFGDELLDCISQHKLVLLSPVWVQKMIREHGEMGAELSILRVSQAPESGEEDGGGATIRDQIIKAQRIVSAFRSDKKEAKEQIAELQHTVHISRGETERAENIGQDLLKFIGNLQRQNQALTKRNDGLQESNKLFDDLRHSVHKLTEKGTVGGDVAEEKEFKIQNINLTEYLASLSRKRDEEEEVNMKNFFDDISDLPGTPHHVTREEDFDTEDI